MLSPESGDIITYLLLVYLMTPRLQRRTDQYHALFPKRSWLTAFAALVSPALLGLRCPNTSESGGAPSPTSQQQAAIDSVSTAESAPLASDARTWIEIRNVNLRVDDHAVLRVRRLHGEVLRTTDEPIFLDDPKSFKIRIVSGTVALAGEDLTTLLNNYVFAYPGAPLKKLKVRTDGKYIVQSGVMHKGVDLSFVMTAELGVLPDGRARLHPVKTEILGVDGMKFLDAIGLKLQQLLDLSKSNGAEVHGNDIYLDATQITPPPKIIGKLASIRVENNELVQDFQTLPDDSVFQSIRPDSTVPNFIYFRGGIVKFGKLTMQNADLLIGDANPTDPFDLYLAKYTDQLIRGTSRTLPNLGLLALLPDYKAPPR